MDTERALERAEEFLRRHMKSKAAREAERRQRRRQWQELTRRLGRAVAVTGASGAGIVGYGLAVAPVGATGLIAVGAATVAAATGMLLWPTRRQAETGTLALTPLDAIGTEAEDWLVRQRPRLPGRAASGVDAVLVQLHDLQPQLAQLDPNAPVAGEARRLIGEHLPRLVDSFLGVPAASRQANPEIERQLVEGLRIVADELARLSQTIGHDRLLSFKTQGRFLETRYGDDGPPER